MWKKKDELFYKEKDNINFITRYKASIKAAMLVLFVVLTISFLSVLREIDDPDFVYSLNGLLKLLFSSTVFKTLIISSALLAIVAFFIRFMTYGMFVKKPLSVICDKCFKIKLPDNNNVCKCGGSFTTLDDFEWVPEEEQTTPKTNMEWIDKYKVLKISEE